MASTNKTINYELSQYIGTDKPSYLGDYNSDMLKIDGAIKNNADNITLVDTKATGADTKATGADAKATQALTNSAQASTTANEALNTANENTQKISKFNLSVFSTITNFTKVGSGTINPNSEIKVATNSDGSLAKIYGQITISNVTNSASNKGKLTFNTSLRPESDIVITGGTIGLNVNSSNQVVTTFIKDFTIKTTGEVEIEYNYTLASGEVWRAIFINSLLFIKDFGDEPINP